MITVGNYSGISNDHSELVKVICVSEGIPAIDLNAFSITECLSFTLLCESFLRRFAGV